MLLHDLTVALRRIASQRLYSAVGVLVLALGVVCFIATYMFVSYVRGYDRSFAKANRTYVIEQSLSSAGAGIDLQFDIASAQPLAEQLRLDVPELAATARYARSFLPVTFEGQSAARAVGYVEAPFYDIFDFQTVAGDLRAATAPRAAVVTRRTAQQLFGAGDPVGKTITIAGAQPLDVTVAAVIEDLPPASHLASGSLFALGFDLLVSWDVFEATNATRFADSWGNTPVMTYALLPADGSFTVGALNDRFPGIIERHVPQQQKSYMTIGFEARPISSIAATNLQTQFQGYYGERWFVDVLGALSIFAAAVLAIACLNFVNLATAQASGRGRDVGTRKAVGATSLQVIRQDLCQTALVVIAAILIALAAIVPVAQLLIGPWQAALAVPWAEPRFWAFLATLAAGVTLAAGLYPALVLARIRPVAALRLGAVRGGPKLLRTVLVGAQFATASFLVAVVIVLFAQRNELRETLLGRFADQYVTFYAGPPGPAPDGELFARELVRGPGIKGASYAFTAPWTAAGPRLEIRHSRDQQAPGFTMGLQSVGYDYFSLLEIPVVAGRVFDRERADDSPPQTAEELTARQGRPAAIVLDRAAARALGWPNPADAVGEIVYPFSFPASEIVGVVESIPMTIRARGSAGMSYIIGATGNQWIVRLGNGDVAASLAHIRDVVKTLAPGKPPPNLLFFDQSFENAYWTFALMNRVLGTLALFAIAIASIGLFGMASYLTARRTREIGVRKTQGASSVSILRLLLWDFSKPVLAANVVAWPFAFYAAQRYLDVFAERTALTPLPFALALLATLGLAWLAVGGRVLRAARVNPTRALRHE